MGLRLRVIHLNRLLGNFQRGLERLLRRIGPAVGVVDDVGEGDIGVRCGIAGFDGDGAAEQIARVDVAGLGVQPDLLAAFQEQVISLDIDRGLMRQAILVGGRQLELERGDNFPR